MKPLKPFVGANDRLDMLLDMGVSPGEDDNYDVQANKLMKEKDKLIDNAKMTMYKRLELAIQNARHKGDSEGVLNPWDFTTQVLAKSIPAPSEIVNVIDDIDALGKALPDVVRGGLEAAKHPIATLKNIALNGPPEPSTLAAMALPSAALATYRNTVPLAARTYLHHMAGVPTPFTNVTKAERADLTKIAQKKIDYLLERQQYAEKLKSNALRQINEIKLMSKDELVDFMRLEDINPKNDAVFDNLTKLKEAVIKAYKKDRPSVFKTLSDRKSVKEDYLQLGYEEDNANVFNEFKEITGKQLNGFQLYPEQFAEALGKTYVEPMVDKATGKIIPKAIKDTYKFYPDVYSFDKGQGRNELKHIMRRAKADLIMGSSKRYVFDVLMSNLLRTDSNSPLGIWARKLGMKRPTSIIDIPLQKPAPLNAYDKAAILMGVEKLTKEKRK